MLNFVHRPEETPMPPSAANIATMNRLAREVSDLNVSIARTNQKIADLQAKINQRTVAFHRATSVAVQRSERNWIEQYQRQIQECHKQNTRFVTQIEQKRAEYHRLAAL